ncbi:hypothetical protein C8R45DRAFT_956728 [Mycena sanguinolenta]|nr:hypothetical protein C8R45DRAFT_956728 [Mycena sanguinolenta]
MHHEHPVMRFRILLLFVDIAAHASNCQWTARTLKRSLFIQSPKQHSRLDLALGIPLRTEQYRGVNDGKTRRLNLLSVILCCSQLISPT